MSLPAVMRALQQTTLNGPQDLRMITDAPVPAPGPGQVLVRVAAAGVNIADISQARGTFRGGPHPPYVAGFEATGDVVELGEGGGRTLSLAPKSSASATAPLPNTWCCRRLRRCQSRGGGAASRPSGWWSTCRRRWRRSSRWDNCRRDRRC